MPGFHVSVRIDKPIAEVFEFFIDLDNAANWIPDATRVERLSTGPIVVGYKYRELRWTKKGEARTDMMVTAIEPPRFYSAAFNQGGYQATFDYHFYSDNDSTVVNMTCTVAGNGINMLLAPLISWMIKRQDKLQLSNLKRVLEGD